MTDLAGKNGSPSAAHNGEPSAGCKRKEIRNPDPGPQSFPETNVRGHVLKLDGDGFGIIEFDNDVGQAQLGFFTVKTEVINPPSRKAAVGAEVVGVTEAVNINVPERAGPVTLPLKRLEFVS